MLGVISNIVAAIIQPALQPRKRLVYSTFMSLLALVIGLTLISTTSNPNIAQQPTSPIPPINPTVGATRMDTSQERDEWKQTETLLRTALADERTYLEDLERSGLAWGTAGQMRQLAGKSYFINGEIPQGGGTVSVVVTGNPNDHPDDVLYIGARIAQRDICIYARDVVSRASASITPGLVWAVATPCVRPEEPNSWHKVSSPLELFDTVPH